VAASTTTVPGAGPSAGSRSFISRLRNGDEIARVITFIFAATVVLITLLLVLQLWHDSRLARHKFGLGFFISRVWDPLGGEFGALPFIYGTLVTAAVALFLAVPLGLGAAIFLAELAPQKISDTLQFFIDLLAAVPSVIYGLLGVFIVIPAMREYIQPALKSTLGFLPLFQGPAYGVSFFTAGIVLAIMLLSLGVFSEIGLELILIAGRQSFRTLTRMVASPYWIAAAVLLAAFIYAFWPARST